MGEGFRDLLESLYEEIGEEYEEPPDTDPPSCNCCECITCCNRVSDEKKGFEKKLQVWCKKGGKRKHLRKVLKDKDLDKNAGYVHAHTHAHKTLFGICFVLKNSIQNEW